MKNTYFEEIYLTGHDIFIDAPLYFWECISGEHREEIAGVHLLTAGVLIVLSWIGSPLIIPVAAALNYINQGEDE